MTVHPPPDDPPPVLDVITIRNAEAGGGAEARGRRLAQAKVRALHARARGTPVELDRLAVGSFAGSASAGGCGTELSRLRDLSFKSSPSIATSTSRQSTSCSDMALEREVTMYGCFKFNPSSR